MNRHPGATRLPRLVRDALALCCTAVLPGRRPAWRPPVPLTGLLEHLGRTGLAPA